jgi:hypothetical protein
MKHMILVMITLASVKLAKVKVKDPLDKISNGDLEKLMGEYGLNTTSLDMKAKHDHNVNNSTNIYENNRKALRNLYLGGQDIYTLLSSFKEFNLFNRLSVTARSILGELYNTKGYQGLLKLHAKEGDKVTSLISNSLNSQSFMDHENKVGRKGLLKLIDTDSAERSVWTVFNSKVVSLYNPNSYLNIIKLYRLAFLSVRDTIYTPCFFLYYNNTDFDSSSSMLCALNFKEKELWLNTLNYHKDQNNYK